MNKVTVLIIVFFTGLTYTQFGQFDHAEYSKRQLQEQFFYTPHAFQLIANRQQRDNILRWTDGIVTTPKGLQTLRAIANSGHQLVIKHSLHARLSAGKTIAPMTENLTNNKGESVLIVIDAEMDDMGTHRVYNQNAHLIEFNAMQNFYHELAHAMHKMQGTWRYFDSEGQAIEEENIFRQELAKTNKEKHHARYGKYGEAIDNLGIASQ